jgi:type II secretory pathway pseudopilin PulG
MNFHRSLRGAFTLVELVVVLTLIAALGALCLPAVQRARHAALQTEEANSSRQLGLALHSHVAARGRLPGPYSGKCGPDEGWSFSVLSGAGETAILEAFDPSLPLNYVANLRVAARTQPGIFAAATIDHLPFLVPAADDPSLSLSILPTPFAFNAFLCNRRIEHLTASSRTALFVLFDGSCGSWCHSPEFYAIQPASNQPVLICFADGSVDRRATLVNVMIDPDDTEP